MAELTLPAARPARRRRLSGAPAADERRPRVLVVDDDPGVRYTLREILESEGLEVDEAADGAEALARLEAAPARAGPHRPADAAARRDGAAPRASPRRPRAPRVVLVTAHGSERQAVEAMKAGAYDYFRKPFETEELLAVVRRAARGGAARATRTSGSPGELALSRSMVFASRADAAAGGAGRRGSRRAT